MCASRSNLLLTAEEAQLLDQWSIDALGLSGDALMERAGSKAADFILETYQEAKRALIIVGKGNNGGDALVVARHLLSRSQVKIDICYPLGEDLNTQEAQQNQLRLQKMHSFHSDRVKYLTMDEALTAASGKSYDFMVDGLFGLGLNRAIDGDLAHWIEHINQTNSNLVALDTPSGLELNDGKVLGTAFKAALTLSFGADKLGFYLGVNREYTGSIHTVDLGYDFLGCKNEHPNHFSHKAINASYSPLPEGSHQHKYDGQAVFIIGASAGLAGATIAVAEAAWAAGASAVFLICPQSLSTAFDLSLPQVVKILVGKDGDLCLNRSHLDSVLSFLDKRKHQGTVVIGPGLGRRPETLACMSEILKFKDIPMVVDADALYAIEEDEHYSNQIWTPHAGELAALKANLRLQIANPQKNAESRRAWSNYLQNSGITLLAKGSPSMLISSDSEIGVCTFEQKAFRRTGFGDVLCGQIAAAYNRFRNFNQAAHWALTVGGAASQMGDHGHCFEASDIINFMQCH